MRKKDYQYKLSDIDMTNIYSEIICELEACPQIVVVEELENGQEVLRHRMTNGIDIIYLKNCKNILDNLFEELENPTAEVYPAATCENHNLDERTICVWYGVATALANSMNVKCPQLMFFHFKECDRENACTGGGMMLLPDLEVDKFIIMLVLQAHEFRHIYQEKTTPEWFEGYIQGIDTEDENEYFMQKSEIDAEAYARKLAQLIWDIDLFIGGDEYMLALKEHSKELEINVDEDTMLYLLSLRDEYVMN